MNLLVLCCYGIILLNCSGLTLAQRGEDESSTTEDEEIQDATTNLPETTTRPTTTTTTTTTTTLPPVGTSKRFVFSSAVPGFSVEMYFTQASEAVDLRAIVSSSATESLNRICLPSEAKKPKIYLVQGFSNCEDIRSQERVNVLEIATLNNPNEDITDTTNLVNINDLEGNCVAVLQDNTANFRSQTSSEEEEASARQVDDAIAIEDATEVISENDEESTTTIQPTTTTTTEPATLENGCPVGSRSRGGRLIMAPRRLTRTFTSISLGSVLVLSTGTTFVAPTIVNSNFNNAPAVVNFGSVPVYTWSPYATLPYLQLPGWTVATVYAIIFGLFIMYMFSIFGTFIPGFTAISRAISRAANDIPAYGKMSRFVNYLEEKSMNGLTNFVYAGINRFKRRNDFPRHRPPPLTSLAHLANKPQPQLQDYNYDSYVDNDYYY